MRIVSWNCNRASKTSPAWDYLAELEPDVALLQEVTNIPDGVRNSYTVVSRTARSKEGRMQRFSSAVLVRGEVVREVPFEASQAWITRELEYFSGNLVACEVKINAVSLSVIAVHNPAWELERERLEGIDVSGVRLKEQREDIWLSDLLWAYLRDRGVDADELLVVGGDFNLSETFDSWSGGPHGNKEHLDRMTGLGLVECLRSFAGQLTPTFVNRCGGKVIHQIDHIFVPRKMRAKLVACKVGDQNRVFSVPLSDHLPVIADFSL